MPWASLSPWAGGKLSQVLATIPYPWLIAVGLRVTPPAVSSSTSACSLCTCQHSQWILQGHLIALWLWKGPPTTNTPPPSWPCPRFCFRNHLRTQSLSSAGSDAAKPQHNMNMFRALSMCLAEDSIWGQQVESDLPDLSQCTGEGTHMSQIV